GVVHSQRTEAVEPAPRARGGVTADRGVLDDGVPVLRVAEGAPVDRLVADERALRDEHGPLVQDPAAHLLRGHVALYASADDVQGAGAPDPSPALGAVARDRRIFEDEHAEDAEAASGVVAVPMLESHSLDADDVRGARGADERWPPVLAVERRIAGLGGEACLPSS